MSLGIYGGSGTPTLYTMSSTRTLRLIYFDGQAAALTKWGTLDSQMTLLQNYVSENPSEQLVFDEDQRALDLCALMKSLKMDGGVRMNAGFEVLVCDYEAAGVELLYSSNLTIPGNKEREEDPLLPQDPNRTPPLGFGNNFAPQNSWEWIRSGTWHYGVSTVDAGSTKETRIELDLCRFLTYYDPIFRSLSGRHHDGLRESAKYQNGWGLRRGHRLLDISHEYINTMELRLQQVYSSKSSSHHSCSRINWQTLTETIINQHRSRIRETLATLRNAAETVIGLQTAVIKVHELSHAILYSYLQYPSAAGISPSEAKNLTISRCASVYTDYIDMRSNNEFEIIIRESIKIVIEELCARE